MVSNPECFAASLRQVHELFGIAEKVPKVGGRELDLHMLYQNVTALGGCEKVIARKLWRVRLPTSSHVPASRHHTVQV